jgi:soluble lytic murein transglycosylase-like protein
MKPARALVVALLALSSAGARADFHCTDTQGRVFVVARPFGATAGVLCRPQGGAGTPIPAVAQPTGGFTLIVESRGRTPLARGPGAGFAPDFKTGLVLAPSLRSASAGIAPTDPALRRMIEDAAREYGHDAGLLRAIIHVESRFNASAVSPKGAIGLMQVMPTTAARFGVREPRTALFDPQANVQTGARYLRVLRDLFVDRIDLAVAAYNAGEGAVLRYHRAVPPYPETQAYVRDVMALYESELARRD